MPDNRRDAVRTPATVVLAVGVVLLLIGIVLTRGWPSGGVAMVIVGAALTVLLLWRRRRN
jgi:fatty acid desaturase